MDTHFTAEQAHARNAEVLHTFVRMAEFAKANHVTAVLICGDLFDTQRISRRTLQVLLDCIASAPQVDFLCLSGNHDHQLHSLFHQSVPENLKLFDREWTSYQYENVTVTGGESPDYEALHLQSDALNILMLHGQVSARAGEDMVCLPALQNKGIDYLALGHLHSYQAHKLDHRGICVYSGCLEGRGFDECGEKGFVLIEVRGNTLTHQFHPFARRQLHDIPVDISHCTTAPELLEVITAATAHIAEQDLVNITFTGTYTTDTQKDLAFLHTMLQDRFYYLKFKDNSRLYIDAAHYAGDVSLKGEFIRTVLASDLPEEERARVICLGLAALQGEVLS